MNNYTDQQLNILTNDKKKVMWKIKKHSVSKDLNEKETPFSL